MNTEQRFIDIGEKAGLNKAVLEHVLKLSRELWPVDVGVPQPDARLSLSLGVEAGVPVISLLADRSSGRAISRAGEIMDQLKGVRTRLTKNAAAQSLYPGNAKSAAQFIETSSGKIVPGISVGSGSFPCGSLSCLLKKGDDVLGASAAHVLDLNASIKTGAWIYAPGRPDATNLTREFRIGRLQNSVDLTPVSDDPQAEMGELTTSTVDIATFRLEFSSMTDAREYSNTVPVSDKKTVALNSIGTHDDILTTALGKKIVNKIGRTTGYRKGYINEFMLLQKPFTLPNRRLYLYADLFSVIGEKGQPFSDHGDSGAPVYTSGGVLLGLVVGSMGDETLCCRAEEAIKTMRAELYT